MHVLSIRCGPYHHLLHLTANVTISSSIHILSSVTVASTEEEMLIAAHGVPGGGCVHCDQTTGFLQEAGGHKFECLQHTGHRKLTRLA